MKEKGVNNSDINIKLRKLIKHIYYRFKLINIRTRIFLTRGTSLKITNKEAENIILSQYTPVNLKNQKIEEFIYSEETDQILLSLIVPIYNEEKSLERCIESLLNQETQHKYEIILIDNASTDNSYKIIEKYKNNSKIRAVKIEVNRGGSIARNYGISLAKGKWIGFIDSDDYVSKLYIDKLLNSAIKNDADVVKCGYFIEKSERIISEKRFKNIIHSGKLGELVLNYDGYIWNSVYKRSLWEKIRFPEECWYEDIIIKLIILRMCNKFVSIDECLYYYLVNSNSTSKKQMISKTIKSADQYYLLKYYLQFLKEIGIKEDKGFYLLLLHELGDMLYYRTAKLDERERKAIFIMAANLIYEYKKTNNISYDIPYEYKIIEKSFINKYYDLWLLASQYKHYLQKK